MSKKKYDLKSIFFAIIFTTQIALGQQPYPPFIRIAPKEFKQVNPNLSPQNLGVVQDSAGLMIVCNTYCLLTFDGFRWKTIPQTENKEFRTLALSGSRVFVGGNNHIGYLKPDRFHRYSYHSLIEKLSPEHRNFGYVWETIVYSNYVFFRTSQGIVVYDLKTDLIKTYFTSGNYWNISPTLRALYVFNDNGFILEFKTGQFEAQRIDTKVLDKSGIADFLISNADSENEIEPLFFSRNKEQYFVLHGKLKTTELESKHAVEAAKSYVRKVVVSRSGNIALTTENNGVYIFAPSGKLRYILNKNNLLPQNYINGACLDQNDGLWLTTDKGIVRISMDSPINYIPGQAGLEGIVLHMLKKDGTLYMASTEGLFMVKDFEKTYPNILFVRNEAIKGQCFKLIDIGSDVLVCSSEGLFQVSNSATKTILSGVSTTASFDKENNIIYAYVDEMIYSFKNRMNTLEILNKPEPIRFSPMYSLVEPSGKCWLSDNTGNVALLNPSQPASARLSYLDERSNKSNGRNKPFLFENSVLWSTTEGLKDYVNEKFRATSQVKLNRVKSKVNTFYLLEQDQEGTYWVAESGKFGRMECNSIGNCVIDFKYSGILPSGDSWSLLPEKDALWASTTEGLIRYEHASNHVAPKSKPTLLLTKVIQKNSESILFDGVYNPKYPIETVVPNRENNLTFEFSSNNFEELRENKFSYRLLGISNNWSSWFSNNDLQFPNLSAGIYSLELRTKDIYGNESGVLRFNFEILPPWYQTTFAYVSYMLVLAIFFGWAIRQNSKRLVAANLRLERMVADRTNEIKQQRDTIAHKNKDIMDSIVYASRIQRAVLPDIHKLNKKLPDNFIFYRPKDIVSGDFYWFTSLEFEEDEILFVAAADCTGHGVPGAFMSMMGMELLNKIIIEHRVIEPTEILSQINWNIKENLQKSEMENDTFDGMDIALCRIDLKSRKISFSGANRLLVECVDGHVNMLKGDNVSLGGHTDTKHTFLRYEIELKPNATYYIYTDGFADQFGGMQHKKFMHKRLIQKFMEINTLSMESQKTELLKTFEEWRGENEQVDDVLIIGFRA